MLFRRITFLLVSLAVLIGTVCPGGPAQAAPPHFRTSFYYDYRHLSPFPSLRSDFIISLEQRIFPSPLHRLGRGSYEYFYDYSEFSITFTRMIKEDVKMVPVTNDLGLFRVKRLEITGEETEFSISQNSLRQEQRNKAGGLFQITIPIRSPMFESIFGEGGAGLKVNGYRRITFSGRSSWTDKEQTAFHRQSKFPSLDMEQVYRFDITGTIGSKISVQVSQDSRNDLPLANRLILRYRGSEDEILQTVEAGNTTLDLPATQFLRYSTRVQGLFGFKATAQIADVSATAIVSQEKGTTESVEISAGSATTATDIIRDIGYKPRTVFDLGRYPQVRARSDTIPEDNIYDFIPEQDSIINAIVYLDDQPTDLSIKAGRPAGICYVDPNDPGYDSVYTDIGNFYEVDPGSYYVDPSRYYILFFDPIVGSNDILAVYLEVLRRRNGTVYVETIGDVTSIKDTLILKLIKPRAHTRINHHVWEYEWRNVYDLRAKNIDLADVEVKIYKGSRIGTNQVNPDDPDNQDGVNYLQIMGLDQFNESNQAIPDGKIDKNIGLIDPAEGYFYFRDRHPFDSPIAYDSTEGGDPIFLRDSVPEMYLSTNATTVNQSSQYYLAVTSKQRGASTVQLNSFNIIEGSEVVTYNDRRLSRGEDYDIDYNLGSVTLLKDEYTDITSNLSIMFEKAPFFSLSKKTLLGTRLEYNPGRDFRLGTTVLYKSDKATNRKPKVGEETSRILVWDVDFDYRFESGFITRMVDALPFISAKSASNIRIAGEVAQSHPNPNVDGQVFIDDFEGSKDSYSLGIMRTIWRQASTPEQKIGTTTERARLGWYNPIDAYSTEEIWNRDEGDANIANVMVVYYQPVSFQRVRDTVNGVIDSATVAIPPEDSWNGFMRNIPDGVVSQLINAQLLEMRLRGDVGIMHVDLGMITEDIDGDGIPDNEDKDGFHNLEDEEDIGLDGLSDAQEFGYNPGAGVYDPAGDNYNPDDMWHMNGTEGNRIDPDGGYRPDTEDPHPYNGMNRTNGYFSYKIDLSDDKFEVARNDSNWKTIRIPLRDPEAIDTIIGEAFWNEIRYARIWFDSMANVQPASPIKIELASVELISTTWADSLYVADSLRSGPVSFDVAVINTEVDNDRYQPPPGVEGYYDPARDIVEKEQSLLLTFQNLNSQVLVNTPDSGLVLAADTGLAVRKFFRANNYMGYGHLEAFVNSSVSRDDSVLFFFRMGLDKNSYYEYRTILDTGLWNPNNHVDIDFEEITGLKGKLLDRWSSGEDSSLVISEGKYLVKIRPNRRDPTLTKIQYFALGVVNLNKTKTVSGEVWIDELRLTDVRNDVGTAARVSLSGNLSDLLSYNFNYAFQDAFYRGPSNATKGGAANNLGSGQTKKNYSFSSSFRLEKLFPRSLELSMPVSVNWSQSVQEPLLRTNSDITVPDELKSRETAVSINKGIRISESINKKTKNPVFTLLLNRLKASFNYSTSQGHSVTRPYYFSERYGADASYSYTLSNVPSIKPLIWMRLFRAPFGLPESKLYLLPNRLTMKGTLTGSYSESLNESGSNPVSSDRFFRGNMSIGFNVFGSLRGDYSFGTTRDLKDPNLINININPKKFKLGVEQSYDQSFRVNYAPKIFGFLTHSMDYSARYADQYRISRDSVFYHSASMNSAINLNLSFKHQALIGSNARRSAGNIRETEQKRPFFVSLYHTALTGIRYITDAVKPVSVKLGRTKGTSFPSLGDKADMLFRLGLTEDPGVEQISTTTGVVRKAKSTSETMSGRSGVSLFSGISADVSYSRRTRESFDANPFKTINEVWPDIRFNLRSIKGLWILGDLINYLSPASSYSRATDTKQRTNAVYLADKKVRESFSPLFSFNIRPIGSMRFGGRYETSSSTSESYNEATGEVRNKTKSTTSSFAVNGAYSFSSPTGFKLPLFGRVKFRSNLSLSVDVAYQINRGESASAATDYEFKITSEKTSLNIRPSASYSFSSNVKGGLSGRWQDSNNLQSKQKRHTREVSIWVEMRF